jgi:hypothetical protein
MRKGIIYIHGKGGAPEEAEHYKTIFPEYEITGFDYKSQTPWEAQIEFSRFFDSFKTEYDQVLIIANSIGAFFTMNALNDRKIEKAYFISPIVDMEKLIIDMMKLAGVTEQELMEKGKIETDFGETLSWEYLSWIRNHPVSWPVPTAVLYGDKDNLQFFDTIKTFTDRIGAELTVMENGEHWFHTEEQMTFLDNWISNK